MHIYPVASLIIYFFPAHRNLLENSLVLFACLCSSQKNKTVVDFCHVQINLYKLKRSLSSDFYDTHSSVFTFLNTSVLAWLH